MKEYRSNVWILLGQVSQQPRSMTGVRRTRPGYQAPVMLYIRPCMVSARLPQTCSYRLVNRVWTGGGDPASRRVGSGGIAASRPIARMTSSKPTPRTSGMT